MHIAPDFIIGCYVVVYRVRHYIAGKYTSSTIYTLTDTGYRISYKGDGAEGVEPVDVPVTVTLADLKEMGEKSCNSFNEASAY